MGIGLKIIFSMKNYPSKHGLIQCSFHPYSHIHNFWGKSLSFLFFLSLIQVETKNEFGVNSKYVLKEEGE